MSTKTYDSGDCVVIKNEEINEDGTAKNDIIGEIIKVNDEEGTVTYKQYLTILDVNEGDKEFRGKQELFKTDQTGETKIINIKHECKILKMYDYIKLSQEEKQNQQTFVVRQFYDADNQSFLPETLEKEPIQEKILNPDEELAEGEDGQIYYKSSQALKPDLKFKDVETEIDNKSLSLNTTKKETEENKEDENNEEELVGSKRKVEQPIYDEKHMVQLQKKKHAIDDNKWKELMAKASLPSMNNDKRVNLGRKTFQRNGTNNSKKKKHKYPNVNEEYVNVIDEHVKNIKESLQTVTHSYAKLRQQSRIKIFMYLLYGIYEIKSTNESEISQEFNYLDKTALLKVRKIKNMKNNEIYKLAHGLSNSIERSLSQKFNRQSDKIDLKYKQKLRMLIPNLKSDKNTEARIKILSEVITPQKLCFVKEDDFIPTAEKLARSQARERYLKKHIVTMSVVEEYQTMIKTHKGMATIDNNNYQPMEEKRNTNYNYYKRKSNSSLKEQQINPQTQRGKEIQKAYLNNPNKVFLSRELKNQLILYSGKQLLNDFAQRYDQHLPGNIARRFHDKIRELKYQ